MRIGIDIGGTSAKIGLLKGSKLLYKSEIPVAFDNYETPIISSVIVGLRSFISEFNIDESKLIGIGVSATGQIDTNNGIVIGGGGHIKNWINTNIKDELEKVFNLRVSVVNDADAMILAEHKFGNAKAYNNVIGVTIGTGVGGGIIVNDQLLLGASGIAGEIGHMVLNASGEKCPCGNVGCFETYASMSALVRRVKKELDDNKIDYVDEDINGRYIFKQVENENILIKKVLASWIKDIALGLVSLVHIFNPEIIIIGGGVSSQEELFLRPLEIEVRKYLLPEFSKYLEIKRAKFANDSGMIGGVAYLEGK